MVKSVFRDRTEKIGLEVTWVEEVMRSAARSMAVISLFFFLVVGYTEAALEPSFVEYKDDLLTVRGSQADVLSLLEEICELVSAQVFVFDKITHHNGGVHLVDKPAEEVLKALLRGHSYAILFSSDPSPAAGVYVLGGTGRHTKRVGPGTRISKTAQARKGTGEGGGIRGLQGSSRQDSNGQVPRQNRPGPAIAQQEDAGGGNDQMSWAVEEAETYLLGEIEKLEWQIAARQSDNDYNPSAKSLGPSPIQHDRDLLEQHKHQLRRLQQQ